MDGSNRPNSFRTFENTKFQAFNERVHFEIAFGKYLVSQQKTYPKVNIEGKDLDVFVLFHLVFQQGGLEEVNRKGWQQVLKAMGIDPNPTNQASVVGYYTACMQSLENSVKGSVNPQFSNFGTQGQQIHNYHGQNQILGNQSHYGNQSYLPPQQLTNQFAQSFSKSPAIFPNQSLNQNQTFTGSQPHNNTQYQNSGLGQYQNQSQMGMGYQGQNQNYANHNQGYSNQIYQNQGFSQSYGQGSAQVKGRGGAFGQNQSAFNVQSPGQSPNQLLGVYSQSGQQALNNHQVKQGQSQYQHPQTQQFPDHLQPQQYVANQMKLQSIGYSPQSFHGQSQSQAPTRQVPPRQQQQYPSYASQLPKQSFSNVMFNQIGGNMQQPFLSQLSVPGQDSGLSGISNASPSTQTNFSQISPSNQSNEGKSLSGMPAGTRRLSSAQHGLPPAASAAISTMSPTLDQAQASMQFLNPKFSSVQPEVPEKTQTSVPVPSLVGNSMHSAVVANNPLVGIAKNTAVSTPPSDSPANGQNFNSQTVVTANAEPADSSVSRTISKLDPGARKANSPVEIKMEVNNQSQQKQINEQIQESSADNFEKDISIKEEETHVEDDANDPNRVRVTTVGGIDFQLVVPYLTRPRAIKEVYSLRSLQYLEIALKSRLPMQIKYALDAMLTISSELGLKFVDCPSLLTSLVGFMFEVLELKGTKDEFIPYTQLFDIEATVISSLQDRCDSSIDDKKLRHDYINMTGLILRNCCLTPENHLVIGSHHGWKKMIFECIQLPLPPEIVNMIKGEELISYTCFHILEQRKNALVSLSSLGHCVIIPDSEKASLILEMCNDFISITNSPYVYPALDALARILVHPSNLNFFTSCENQSKLVKTLLELVPPLGFSLSASTQQLSEWELVMMILGTVVTNCDYHILEHIAKIPKFSRIMFNLAKKPGLHFRSGLGQEAYAHLHGMRERGLRCLLTVLKVEGMTTRWEQELLEFSISSHLSGDSWIGPIIFQEISLRE